MGGGLAPKNRSFSHWATLGAPGEPMATKMEAKGATMTPGDPKIEVLGCQNDPRGPQNLGFRVENCIKNNLIQEMVSAVAGLGVSHWIYIYIY